MSVMPAWPFSPKHLGGRVRFILMSSRTDRQSSRPVWGLMRERKGVKHSPSKSDYLSLIFVYIFLKTGCSDAYL